MLKLYITINVFETIYLYDINNYEHPESIRIRIKQLHIKTGLLLIKHNATKI